MKQVFAWRSGNNPSATTSYMSPLSGPGFSTTEHRGSCPCPADGTFSKLTIRLLAAPGVGNSLAFTLLVDGIASLLTVIISDTGTSASDLVNSVSVMAGQTITVRADGTSGPTVSHVQVALDFDSTDSTTSIHGFGPVDEPVSITRTNTLLYPQIQSNWNENNARSVAAIDGTITHLYADIDITVAAASSWVFAILKNAVVQDGSGGTPDTRITYSDGETGSKSTVFSLDVARGDRLSIRATPSGTPGAVRPQVAIRFIADTPDECNFGLAYGSSLSTSSTVYHRATADLANAWSTTEADHVAVAGATGFVLDRLQGILNLSPSAGRSYQLSLRKNGSGAGPTVTIADLTTTADDLTNSALLTNGDAFAVESIPSGTPSARAGGLTFRQRTSAPQTNPIFWLPSFPAALPPPDPTTALHASGRFSPVVADSLPDHSWAPRHPDRFPAPHPSVLYGPPFAGLGLPIPAPGSLETGWLPRFVDRLDPSPRYHAWTPAFPAFVPPFRPTRFYFPSTTLAAAEPAFGTGWNRTDLALRRRLEDHPTGTAFADHTVQVSTSEATSLVLARQYVSDPLEAGRIDGAVKGSLRALEDNPSVQGTLALRLALVDSSGGTVREILAVTASTLATTPPEFGSALTTRRFQNGLNYFSVPVDTPRPVNWGDRLVVEIGFREGTSNPARDATFNFGDASSTDLPENETATSVNNPWIEFSSALTVAREWTAHFPDRIDRAPGRPDLLPATFLDVRPTPPPHFLSWGPIFPAEVLPPVRLVPDFGVMPFGAIDFPITVALFAWRPTFPARIARLVYPTPSQQAFAIGYQATNAPPPLSWKPEHPDWLPGQEARQSLAWVGPIDPLPNDASPDLAWRPIFPDVALGPSQLPAALQAAWGGPVGVIPTVTDESWLPIFPDRLDGPRWVPALVQPPSLQRFPIVVPDLLAGMTWAARFPDQLWRPGRPIARTEVTAPAEIERALAPVAFLPRFPDRIDRAVMRPELQSTAHAPPPGGFLVVGQSLAWLPIYPSYLPGRVVLPTASGFLVDPGIIAGAVFCVALDDVAGTAPQIAGETLTLSAILDEAVTAPTLLEALC